VEENKEDMTSEDNRKFDKMKNYSKQAELMNFNDDLIFIMVTHILTMGVAISSGYHDNHFAVGESTLPVNS
jgi:hypothetical protein